MIIINTYNEGFSFSTGINLYQFSYGDISTDVVDGKVHFIFESKIGLSNFFITFNEITINSTQVDEDNVYDLLKLLNTNTISISSSDISIIDSAKIETPAMDSTGQWTYGQLLR